MKNIILLSFVLIGLFSKAQQVELIQNDWYLQKIIIEEVEYITPINEEVNEVPIHFHSDYFSTYVCNIAGGTVQYYSSGPNFIILGMDFTLMDCNLSENAQFESLYFGQFFYHESEIAGPFVYAIEEVDTYQLLSITNSVGVQAIYHTQNTVSISDVDSSKLSLFIYPNPTNGILYIQNSEKEQISYIDIYDIMGQQIISKTIIKQQCELDISCIDKGVYLIRVSNENGMIVLLEKIVKK
ncbi:MAG: T9SS type A sorting domain-containing protein [Bacteroidales bacterium]|nr:T9SS type A sorting domain-containing protein [Bacteroidales bacterium]